MKILKVILEKIKSTRARLIQQINYLFLGSDPKEIMLLLLMTVSITIFPIIIFANINKGIELRKKLVVREEALKKSEGANKTYEEILPRFNKLGDDINLLETAVPEKETVNFLLNKINFILGKGGLIFTGAGFEPPRLINSYEELVINITFKGNYTGIVKMIEIFEREEQQFDMEDLRIQITGPNRELEGNLRVKTYYFTNLPR